MTNLEKFSIIRLVLITLVSHPKRRIYFHFTYYFDRGSSPPLFSSYENIPRKYSWPYDSELPSDTIQFLNIILGILLIFFLFLNIDYFVVPSILSL